MQPYQTTFIDLCLHYKVLQFGQFTLKSGRISPYFFNAGLFQTGRALASLGNCYAQALLDQQLPFDMLFGPAYKGIPLVSSTAIALSGLQRDVPYCFNRKEAKDHGEGGVLIGAPLEGRVVIVDDVITAGTAIRASLPLIQKHAQLSGIVLALDRQERGQESQSAVTELSEELQVPIVSILSLTALIDYLRSRPSLATHLSAMDAYRASYGASTPQ